MRCIFSTTASAAWVIVVALMFGAGCGSEPATERAASAPLAGPSAPATDAGKMGAAMKSAPAALNAAPIPRQELSATISSLESVKEVKRVAARMIDRLFQMDGISWFGLAAVAAMVIFYSLENRSHFFILAFAAACWTGAAYGFVQGSWPIEIAAGVWGAAALGKWRREIKSKRAAPDREEELALVAPTRLLCVLAVISGVVLLIVDSPIAAHVAIPISRAVAEALPLLLVGAAYLGWLVIDRPATMDLIKQVLIAVAFILWGVNNLMLTGRWATFVGAVVIAIYVFDLAWLMEGNLRKTFGVRSMRRAGEGLILSPGEQSSPQPSAELPEDGARLRMRLP